MTSKHVVFDEASSHRPDRLEVTVHSDASNLAASLDVSIPLYDAGLPTWKTATDGGGEIDVAVVEIDRSALPPSAYFQSFKPKNLPSPADRIDVGSTLLAIGFPMGFHDDLHRLPVARQAGLASSFGLRFQGQGYFLVDARTHRGLSGAPIVCKRPTKLGARPALPWRLLGVHSARIDMGTRDPAQDETLGLNAVWYADVLMTLTEK